MKLTLGKASKEAGVSKTAISNAIKSGRLSAIKTDTGSYEIDPAELFRVYPPKPDNETERLTTLDPKNNGATGVNEQVLTVRLTGQEKLLEEKDRQIERLIREHEQLEERLTESAEQQKRLTLLLTDQSEEGRAGDWQKSFRTLEERIANQENKAQKEIGEVKKNAHTQVTRYRQELEQERSKPLWQKLFGKRQTRKTR